MADPISSVSSSTSIQRAQTAAQNSSLRNNQAVLNSIIQTQQKTAGASNRVALATPAGNSSKTKLPRGSLIDVLA